MIYMYTGRPGSGKSLHMASEIHEAIWSGKNVIANFEINESYFAKAKHPERLGKFIYVNNREWMENAYTNRTTVNPKTGERMKGVIPDNHYTYIDGLFRFALQFHERDRDGNIKEHQTLLVLDECQLLFNSRMWSKKDRLEWIAFFREHRKYGYDVYLVSQDDTVIDKQIRQVMEIKVEHRNVKNYKTAGKLLALLRGGHLFIWIMSNYAIRGKEAFMCSEYFTGRKFFNFYNSYQTFRSG